MTTTAPDRAPAQERAPDRSWSALLPLLARMHFYAGIFVAPFIAVAALTGLLYTVTPQLEQLVYADELTVERVDSAPRPLAEQVDAALDAHPEGTLSSVIPGPNRDATTQVVLAVPELGENQRTVYVDPYTAEVRGALTTSFGSTPLKMWISELHKNLHLGDLGRMYSELAASWLWLVVLGGLVLWLVRRRQYRGSKSALVPDLSAAKGVRRTRSWHASTGVWLTLGLLILSATGLTWSAYAGARFDQFRAAVRAEAPVLDTARPAGNAGALPIDDVLARARAAGLDGPVSLAPPEDATTAWTVGQTDNTWPVRLDKVAIDPSTGEVTSRSKFADYPLIAKLSKVGIQAHMGVLFGVVNQVLLAALALGLLCVIAWGYRMWWQRRPTGSRFGRAPNRVGWRRVPVPALVVGVPLAIAVGWALPLLGITLAGFLALDAAVGALDRR